MFPVNKTIIRERLLRERDKLEILTNRVGFARKLTLKGASDNWSVKEALTLVLAREQFIADRLEEALHGDVYVPSRTPMEFDAFLAEFGHPDFESPLLDENQACMWITEKYRTIALDEIVIQDIETLTTILMLLEKMPEEKMTYFRFVDRVAAHTIRYYRQHTAKIGEWFRSVTVKQR